LLQCLQAPTCKRHQSPLLSTNSTTMFTGTHLHETPISWLIINLDSPLGTNLQLLYLQAPTFKRHQSPQTVNNSKPLPAQIYLCVFIVIVTLHWFKICLTSEFRWTLHLPTTHRHSYLLLFYSLASSDLMASTSSCFLAFTSATQLLSYFLQTSEPQLTSSYIHILSRSLFTLLKNIRAMLFI
jgi:hypothetical protein